MSHDLDQWFAALQPGDRVVDLHGPYARVHEVGNRTDLGVWIGGWWRTSPDDGHVRFLPRDHPEAVKQLAWTEAYYRIHDALDRVAAATYDASAEQVDAACALLEPVLAAIGGGK